MFGDLFKGRYGFDTIGLLLLILSVIFFRIGYLWILGFVIIGYALFRVFSKNISKRRMEQQNFNKVMAGIINIFKPLGTSIRKYKMMAKQRKNYVFLRCPKCKKTLRLPKNKGNLQVTCPVCKGEFMKKT